MIDRYKIILWWSEEDKAFLAQMPELPGCMADGPTQEEALRNVRETAHLWIETARSLGREIPQPASVAVAA